MMRDVRSEMSVEAAKSSRKTIAEDSHATKNHLGVDRSRGAIDLIVKVGSSGQTG